MNISNMNSEQLADYVSRQDNFKFIPKQALPTPSKVGHALRSAGVTYEMLKYGIPFEGLTPLHRCHLFSWFNRRGRLGDDEQLLMPVLLPPNPLTFSTKELDFFLEIGFGIERSSNEPLNMYVDPIATKLWEVLELVRKTPLQTNPSIKKLARFTTFEDFRAYVASCAECSQEHLQIPDNMIEFMTANQVIVDQPEIVARLQTARVNFNTITYGLYMEGFTFRERVDLFEKMRGLDFFAGHETKLLQCPSLLWPANIFQDVDLLKKYMLLCDMSTDVCIGTDEQSGKIVNLDKVKEALVSMIMRLRKAVYGYMKRDIGDDLFYSTKPNKNNSTSFEADEKDVNSKLRVFLDFCERKGQDYAKF